MDELFKQLTGITSANNTNIMSGIELGRDESAARIKKLEDSNAKMLKALKDIAEGCSFPDDEVQKAIVTRARQAIKKAEESTWTR